MNTVRLLHHLVDHQAAQRPDAPALVHRGSTLTYAALRALQDGFANGLGSLGHARGARVGIFLSKCPAAVAAAFGSSKAGACFVPINPVLKTPQVTHILNDCSVRVLVTSPERLAMLQPLHTHCPSVETVVLVGGDTAPGDASLVAWEGFVQRPHAACCELPDGDMAAILYTSGSTGLAKGVVVSHRNLVSGAASVASYLGNRAEDRLLAALPLSFDAGFSQLTTAFIVGAAVVLLDYLTPHEVVRTLAQERITGLTAVPPLWIQLSTIDWPAEAAAALRYFANTGGKMPRETLARLRARAPAARPFLMYGLTEAFRSTYLPPEEVDRRPDSIGKAIPNQEILVLRADGTRCAAHEAGELVHRGSTVTLGYWGDAKRTAERFRTLPPLHGGLMLTELAVYSGDIVQADEDGFLYFIGRRDEMIKSSGYRISPVEVEDAVYATGGVAEAAAFGTADEQLGQTVTLVVFPHNPRSFDAAALRRQLQQALPAYMVPKRIEVAARPLPRNANGKIDRALLSREAAMPAAPQVAPQPELTP